MRITQGTLEESSPPGPLGDATILDAVVPPVAAAWRVGTVMLLVVVLAVVGWLARWDGGYAPQLSFGRSSTFYGSSNGGLYLGGDLESDRLLPVTITAIDAAAPGLGDPRVSFVSLTGHRLALPLRLQEGEQVMVRIDWKQLDCASISPRERYYMSVRYTDVAGLSGTVDIAPLWWVQTSAGTTSGTVVPGPVGIGWPAGVSWAACGHPIATAPSGTSVAVR